MKEIEGKVLFTLKSLINEQGGDLLKKSNGLFRGTIRLYLKIISKLLGLLKKLNKTIYLS